MKIALIVHQDNVFPNGLELYSNENTQEISGTLDNFMGVAIVFRLIEFIHKFKIPVYFTNDEEINLGDAKKIARELPKDVLPIVVDVANVKGKYDCELSNIYGFKNEEIKDIKDYIEGRLALKCKTRKYTGEPEDEDDSWAFIKAGRKTLTYTIPVNGDFHTTESWISTENIFTSTQGLKWLISYFISL